MTIEEHEALLDFASNYDNKVSDDVKRRYKAALKVRAKRDADFWDIAKHEPERECEGVDYKFLGMTGCEEE